MLGQSFSGPAKPTTVVSSHTKVAGGSPADEQLVYCRPGRALTGRALLLCTYKCRQRKNCYVTRYKWRRKGCGILLVLKEKGSVSCTSSAAARMRPSFSAAASACSSTRPPRAVFTRNAPSHTPYVINYELLVHAPACTLRVPFRRTGTDQCIS